MRFNRVLIPVTLALALSASALSAEAAQDGSRDDHGNRGRRSDQARPRQGSAQRRETPVYVAPRGGPLYAAPLGRPLYVAAPRIIAPRYYSPRRFYGPGPGLNVYFALGSGYRYGVPYYGPVYGYSAPVGAYGPRRYYGDVRIQVRPRDAAVYVDGYYAGIVDDFDGTFQRLSLEVGPHRIEIEAPGYETRVYDVNVDPIRSLDLHGDLYPQRP